VAGASLGFKGNGRRKRRLIYAATKKDAQNKLRKLQTSADAGTLPDAGCLTVGDYITRWLENHARCHVRSTTFQTYETLARKHITPALGGVRLAQLRALHIEAFNGQMERQGAGASTRRAAAVLLTSMLRHAVKLKLIPFDPSAAVAKPRPEVKEIKFLTEAQTRQFLGAAKGNRLYALFALAIGTGMRQGEILGLRWSDIDFVARTISVQRSLAQLKKQFLVKEPKSRSSRRTISLPDFVVDALQDHRAAMLAEGNIDGPVFCNRAGHFICKSNLIRRDFKPILDRANADARKKAKRTKAESALLPAIRFHDLRHTHATQLLSRGTSIKAVSHRLGHADVKVTLMVYAHVLPSDDRAIADGLNRLYG
jgi:integrase